ncbi:hypothetical protein [Streptomyces sp. NBC_01614]|uniref:hypothetical protein n=1 Tax=Streptomyces sp. NBC_01614 TaxID=2975897 RepID=UPI003868481F
MGKYLRRRGPSFQRPDKRAAEHGAETVRVWREETWPAIRATAKAANGECFSLTRPASALTRSPAAPGARRAAPQSCAAVATGSR